MKLPTTTAGIALQPYTAIPRREPRGFKSTSSRRLNSAALRGHSLYNEVSRAMKSTSLESTVSPSTPNSIPPRRQPPLSSAHNGSEAAIEAYLVDEPAADTELLEASLVNEEPVPAESPAGEARGGFIRRTLRGVGNFWEWCFGVVALVVVLALISTIPIVQFISLGYLLEASGRIARSGRFRDGLIDIRKFYRMGTVILGTFLVTRPLWLAIDTWQAARLIEPGSPLDRGWGIGVLVLGLLTCGHVAWAWFRGGKLRHFLWPAPVRLIKEIWRGGMFSRAADGLWEFLVSLNAWHYLSLGFRGFVGALAWLVIPAGILALGHSGGNEGAAGVVSFVGILAMAFVLLYLPFLQTHMAAENRLKAIFAWGEVRRQFRHAPLCYWLALFVTLLFALPLFLLKIEVTPREATWLASLVFVVSILPARLLTGWAVGQARRRDRMGHWLFRWSARLAALPVVLFFALIVFLTPSLLWYGRFSLFEQHAFLLPVPFLGL